MSSGASGPPNRLARHPSGGETFHGPIELITLGDWDWVLGVELMSNKKGSSRALEGAIALSYEQSKRPELGRAPQTRIRGEKINVGEIQNVARRRTGCH